MSVKTVLKAGVDLPSRVSGDVWDASRVIDVLVRLRAKRLMEETETEMHHRACTLAAQMAKRIVASELTTRPEAINAIVEEALNRMRQAQSVTVRVHPTLHAALESWVRRQNLDDTMVHVEPDENLEPGDCVLASELGEVDARIDTKLEHLLQISLDSFMGITHE